MATTVGATVSSTEMVVAQFNNVTEETTVESLMIEFDQAKYEEYLSSSSSSEKASRRCRRVVRVARPQETKVATPKCFAQTTAGGYTSTEPSKAELMAGNKSQTAAKRSLQPHKEGSKIHLGADHVIVIGAESSKRTKQRRRQTLARRKAAASTVYDGLNYYSGTKQTRGGQAQSHGDLLKSGEPTYTGRPNTDGDNPKTNRLGLPGEPHFDSEVPYFGELGETGGPLKSSGVHYSRHLADHCCTGEAYQPHLNEQTAGVGQRTEARLKKKPRRSRRARVMPTLEMPAHFYEGSLEPSASERTADLADVGDHHLQPTGDLRDYLTRKRTIRGANPRCHC